MSICYYELADNRYLGMSVFEISSFPGSISGNTNLQESFEKIGETFQQILSETHRMVSQNVSMELLWLTEMQFTVLSGRCSVLERPLSEIKRSSSHSHQFKSMARAKAGINAPLT